MPQGHSIAEKRRGGENVKEGSNIERVAKVGGNRRDMVVNHIWKEPVPV
jgi:hypothetical protein